MILTYKFIIKFTIYYFDLFVNLKYNLSQFYFKIQSGFDMIKYELGFQSQIKLDYFKF